MRDINIEIFPFKYPTLAAASFFCAREIIKLSTKHQGVFIAIAAGCIASSLIPVSIAMINSEPFNKGSALDDPRFYADLTLTYSLFLYSYLWFTHQDTFRKPTNKQANSSMIGFNVALVAGFSPFLLLGIVFPIISAATQFFTCIPALYTIGGMTAFGLYTGSNKKKALADTHNNHTEKSPMLPKS